MIVPATGAARSRQNSAAPHRWLLGLGVLLLSAGVIAMHSLGVGHHIVASAGSATTLGHTSHQSVATPDRTPSAINTSVDASGPGAAQAADGAMGHGLTALCLAVLPVLLLLLRRHRSRGWFVSVWDLARGSRRGGVHTSWTMVPPQLAEALLAKLCVLRT